MKIYTREEDDDEILDGIAQTFDSEKQLLWDGTGANSPYHQWFLAYYLRTSKTGRHFGLEIIDYGDPQEKSEHGESELAVIVEDPETSNLREISDLLISTYESLNTKSIEFIESTGDIMEES
jgi:hypothetical protein